MNATDFAPHINPRLNKIKTVSRAAKYLALGFMVFTAAFMLLMFLQCADLLFRHPAVNTQTGQPGDFALRLGHSLATWGFQVVLCVWYWKLSRLFRFYERGLIFAAESIRCIKVLGGLFFLGGMFTTILRSLPKLPPPVLQSGVTLTATRTYHMGFFRFDFGTDIDFGLLLAGAVIMLIAWIMDEGRKIQEEQELTV